ncbi:glycoside hydrolase family 47 protein [Crucibulum laeve]|uniref:alpha-1,2-Mannosidase n=1 Tax=Crucibulum laeve TaxID=68775 RepID=A0A5C3M4X1_9AGAR|nr:glycoside hydrolase family 47 protein [Crucibulum laeve]
MHLEAVMPHYRQLSQILGKHRYQQPYRLVLYGSIFLLSLYGLYYTWKQWDATLLPDQWRPGGGGANVSPHVWKDRSEKVKEAFRHAYRGYERYAIPSDELKPLSDKKVNNFNGWGVTMYDSLDTMLLMGLEDEYKRALAFIEKTDFSVSSDVYAPYFETVIRYLGGLLSAHALSKDALLLKKADELAMALDPIFASPSGMPFYAVNPKTYPFCTIEFYLELNIGFNSGQTRGPEIGILAEIASLQMEYTYLAKLTGNRRYFSRANAVMQTLANANLTYTGGMFPIRWNLTSGQPYDYHVSVGAQADSAHEYLLKQYLLTGKTDQASLDMYIRATTHIINHLLFLSPKRHLLYVSDTHSSTHDINAEPSQVFEHLSCFLPGLLALGAHTLPLDKLESLHVNLDSLGNEKLFGHAGKGYKTLSSYNLKQLHLWAAEGLAQTCWLTYADQPSRLAPDEIQIKVDPAGKTWDGTRWWQKTESYSWIEAMEKWRKSGSRGVAPGVGDKAPVVYSESERKTGKGSRRDYAIRKSGYLLRPETVESLYILWRVTGDTKWRTRGWAIFEAIEKECRTASGYANLISVQVSPAPKEDSMPSYFLAETLKYLYLMFIDDDPLPLDKWVFNTEAHAFPMFRWTEKDKDRLGI